MKSTYIFLFFLFSFIFNIQSMAPKDAMPKPNLMPIAAQLVIKQLKNPDATIPTPDLVVFHGAQGTGKSHLIDQFVQAINAHPIQEDMDFIIAGYEQSKNRMSANKYIENRFFAPACDASSKNNIQYTAIILDKLDHLNTLEQRDKFALMNALFNLNALRNQNADHASPPFLIIGEAEKSHSYGNYSVAIAVSHPSGEQVNELYAYFLAQKGLSLDEDFQEHFGQGSIDILEEHSIALIQQCVDKYADYVKQKNTTSKNDDDESNDGQALIKEKDAARKNRMARYLKKHVTKS